MSVLDEVTVRYLYTSPTNPVTVTLLLDRDLDPLNDSINNPGDPLDPNTNIIILPSGPRLPNDPTFDGDPPPPDDVNNPPAQPDSIELRTNPRTLDPTLFVELKEYRFVIDFTQIPISVDPLFIRATFTDGNTTQHIYAIGSVTISGLASGTVDADDLGFRLAGARFQGFSAGEYLGTSYVGFTDLDLDGNGDFMVASRYASPRARNQGGAGYLIYGRRKTPFPPDTNGNGLPDLPGQGGEVVDFPEPPTFLPNPYDSRNVGRFGGTISVNSVSSFFRGTVFGMPEAHNNLDPLAVVPLPLFEPNHPAAHSAGLYSMTRIDMTADGVPDWVFGLPYVASAWDHHDDDPADGCDIPYGGEFGLADVRPNSMRCTDFAPDPLSSDRGPAFRGALAG
ncbi:MAG: hypothetical protein GY778_28430, partial [bacterium]|nr:hypothetical protein [bacterium]